MNTVAIVQARLNSKRFPNKVLKSINNKPIIEILLERLGKSKFIDKIVVAIPEIEKGNLLDNFLKKKKINLFYGSEIDVLDRYFKCAKKNKADIVVRITADCPLVDPEIVDKVIVSIKKGNYDLASNTGPETSFPDGLDVEVFTFKALKKIWLSAKAKSDREHVTNLFYKSKEFKVKKIESKKDFSNIRLTIDEQEDYNVISEIVNFFHPKLDFKLMDIINFLDINPQVLTNVHLKRHSGHKINSGQKLWKFAKTIIPSGNMLLSKNPDRFLPDKWPTYYKKAQGCKIWDLDDNEYLDFSIMGVGTNILGYGNKKVDEKVINSVKNGNMSTLNCPEEIYLAEKLIELHPWFQMVKFARTGGEANSIAIRISRAASNKDGVAVCGYHGWHDWYLSSNLQNQNNLDTHLIKNLQTDGVPKALKNTVFPFAYNDFDSLKEIVENQDIGTIKMEVYRNLEPKDNFLEKVRDLATKKNIVLIFDECTSGFRKTFGGLHKFYNVIPDVAMFGKALGNGYAITAVVGKKEVMECAQNTFISSTFWTERIGSVAGLATLNVMEELKSWEKIDEIGSKIKKTWTEIAKLKNIPIKISGLNSIAQFKIISKKSNSYKTLITQEMLKNNILATDTIFVCIKHQDSTLQKYYENLEKVFGLIHECLNGRKITDFLKSPEGTTGLPRLN